MTKADVKKLCEADDKLQWWAMVLFAEIAELVAMVHPSQHDLKSVWPTVQSKVEEFPRLVVQRKLEEADERPSLEERVAKLEEWMGTFGTPAGR